MDRSCISCLITPSCSETRRSTTKVRIVYDAWARSTGPSLNDCFYPGPKFNQMILNILLQFCVYKILLTGDIEKAFLMISVAEEDKDVLRFLWFENVFLEEPTLVEMRLARVVFRVSSSPFFLNATIKHHLERFLATHTETVTSILQSLERRMKRVPSSSTVNRRRS